MVKRMTLLLLILRTFAGFNFAKLEEIDMWLVQLFHYEGYWSASTAISDPISRIVRISICLIKRTY